MDENRYIRKIFPQECFPSFLPFFPLLYPLLHPSPLCFPVSFLFPSLPSLTPFSTFYPSCPSLVFGRLRGFMFPLSLELVCDINSALRPFSILGLEYILLFSFVFSLYTSKSYFHELCLLYFFLYCLLS